MYANNVRVVQTVYVLYSPQIGKAFTEKVIANVVLSSLLTGNDEFFFVTGPINVKRGLNTHRWSLSRKSK